MAQSNEPEDELARILAGVQLQEVKDAITNIEFINLLNDLRILEQRPLLTDLPIALQHLSESQRSEWVKRIKSEIAFHKNTPSKYPLIILNRTEIHLISINRSVLEEEIDEVPITHLPYNVVDANDLIFYFPKDTVKHSQVFVTDSDCRLIGTPTYSTAGSCFIATHNLKTVWSTKEHTLQFINPTFQTSTPRISVDTDSDSDTSNSDTSSVVIAKQYNNIIRKLLENRQKRKRAMTDDDDSNSVVGPSKHKARMVELEEENATLLKQLQGLKLQHAKPTAKSEREELSDIRRAMEVLIHKVDTNINFDTTAEEKEIIDRIKEGHSTDPQPNWLYKLKTPDNIIPITESREKESLAILKPSVISNTIGTFEPDTEIKADFRGIWERILDHTKNVQMYEHEYITCLRMVMKGSAATALDKMTKEYDGNLENILEAIQDLYIPQVTFFDEYDELSNFTRQKNEHIRTTLRRASLAVYALRDTVSKAAWPDRRHHLLSSIIKQVIHEKTAMHLRMKENECAQQGTQLTLDAMINIISLYETSHRLIPNFDKKLTYNVNTLQLIKHKDQTQVTVEDLKSQIANLNYGIKSLTAKKPRTEGTPGSMDRPKAVARRRLEGRPENRGIKRTSEEYKPKQSDLSTSPSPYASQSQYRPTQSQNTRYPHNRPILRKDTQPKPYAAQYHGNTGTNYSTSYNIARKPYSSNYNTSQRYQNSNYRGTRYTSRNRGYTYGKRGNKRRSYNFQHGKNDVTLNFYKCSICPSMHPEGQNCPDQGTVSQKALTLNP